MRTPSVRRITFSIRPGAGVMAGRVASGSLAEVLANKRSPTGRYLTGTGTFPAQGKKEAVAGSRLD